MSSYNHRCGQKEKESHRGESGRGHHAIVRLLRHEEAHARAGLTHCQFRNRLMYAEKSENGGIPLLRRSSVKVILMTNRKGVKLRCAE